MSTEAHSLQINIMGREFRVACKPDEEKSLREAVDYLNLKMKEIESQGKITGIDRVAIMAALNITHEFLATRFGDFDVSSFKRRMTVIENIVDEALAAQDELF